MYPSFNIEDFQAIKSDMSVTPQQTFESMGENCKK